MKLGIMQPYFFPYIGYFQLMNAVDRWVVFDQVQFIDKGWINRNRILHPDAEKEWQYITVPLAKKAQFDKICDISIKTEIDWRNDILGKLTSYRRKAPYYQQTRDFVRDCFDTDETKLAGLVVRILRKTATYLGIRTPIEVQSEMNLQLGEICHPGQWALRISQVLGADEYLNPAGGRSIFNKDEFYSSNIKLGFLSTNLNVYAQKRLNFVAGLSIIDVMMFNSMGDLQGMLYDYSLSE